MAASVYECLTASTHLASHCSSDRGACGFVLVAQPYTTQNIAPETMEGWLRTESCRVGW
jgi:hypothetical protein